MEYTSCYTMFYVEPADTHEVSIVLDVLRNEGVDFIEANGRIHMHFIEGGEYVDDRVTRVAEALKERNIDMLGHVARVTMGDCFYSVRYGFVENGELFFEDLEDISSHINRIDDFMSIRAFADRKDRKHLCVTCPECGMHTEAYADFGNAELRGYAKVFGDVSFEGVFRCGNCYCELTDRTAELKNSYQHRMNKR